MKSTDFLDLQTPLDLLVVGAGPGGLAAATAAAEHGLRVTVVDDNPAAGGQIWRDGMKPVRGHGGGGDDRAREKAIARFERSGARLLRQHRVFAAPAAGVLHALDESGMSATAASSVVRLRYRHLVIATGARERFLPFPGWTLPGVFGAGGLQALVKGGFPVRGKRIVIAGTGPLLLAVAAHLRAYGATVVCIAEAAPLRQLAPFAAGLWSQPGKIWQGLRYRFALRSSPFRTGCWAVEALPHPTRPELRGVRLTEGRRTWEEPCDLLATGFHLVPNTELASLLGCDFSGNFVQVNSRGETSISGVYCVGEPTGIAGLEAARIQGRIAGLSCAGGSTAKLQRRARVERRFGDRLERAFALRPELRTLPAPETVICRCEDVRWEQLSGRSGWTDAKLQSRCGMGPCQARVCGPAVEFLLGWKNLSVRAPLFPVPLHALLFQENTPEETR